MQNAHKNMSLRVTYLMKKIPFLKPYFELLKMITFGIHYLPNLQKIGLFPTFRNAIPNKYVGQKYCKSIPKVFPPLPIRKKTSLKIEITTSEILNIFKNNKYEELNAFISKCFYEIEANNMNEAVNNQKNLFDKIKNYIKQKVKNNLSNEDKYIINYLSDEKLKIQSITNDFILYLFIIPKLGFIKEFNLIYDTLQEQKNELYKPKKSKEYIITINSFSELNNEINELLNLFGIYSMDDSEKELNEMNKINEEINQKIEDEKKKVKDFNTKQLLEKKKQEMIKENKKLFEERKKDLEKALDKLKSCLDNLQNDLIYYKVINENIINISKPIQKKKEIIINYSKTFYDTKKNKKKDNNNHINENENEKEKYFPIRGGCFPKINNNLVLRESEEINNKIYNEFIDEKINIKKIEKNPKRYSVVKTELINGFIYNDLLRFYTSIIDINKIIMQFFSY